MSLSTVGLRMVDGVFQGLPEIGTAAGLSYAAARYLPLKLVPSSPSNAFKFTAIAATVCVLAATYWKAMEGANGELTERKSNLCDLFSLGLLAYGVYRMGPEKTLASFAKASVLATLSFGLSYVGVGRSLAFLSELDDD